MENSNKKISLYYERNKYEIEIKDIKFVKAYAGEAGFRIKDTYFRRKNSLNEIEKMLDGRIFFRVNKSYIVNLAKVEKYRDEIIIIDKEEIAVSRRRKKEFEKKLIEYKINNL